MTRTVQIYHGSIAVGDNLGLIFKLSNVLKITKEVAYANVKKGVDLHERAIEKETISNLSILDSNVFILNVCSRHISLQVIQTNSGSNLMKSTHKYF